MAMARRRRGGGGGGSAATSTAAPATTASTPLLLRLLLLVAVGPLAAYGFGPFGTGGGNSLRSDAAVSSMAGGRRGGWVPPALRPVVRVRACVRACVWMLVVWFD
jgi:hypothetical protein